MLRSATLDDWLIPPKLAGFRRLRRRSFTLLDVGCGNHSASLTKRWYPLCRYFGVDRANYNHSPRDFARMERFYSADLEISPLTEIPGDSFDVIICAHALEHLRGGMDLLPRLCSKLAPGGRLYLEFPSLRSLSLPSARGTQNFCDDATHARLCSLAEVCNLCLGQVLLILRAGRRRSWPSLLLTPLLAAASWARHGAVTGGVFGDLLCLADYVVAATPRPERAG